MPTRVTQAPVCREERTTEDVREKEPRPKLKEVKRKK